MEFKEAEELLISNVKLLDTETISIDVAFNRVLAEDLIATKNIPPFNRSPLDGYCFNYIDTIGVTANKPKKFQIIEEVPCGKVATKKLGKNQTIKLLTGAKMPEGANSVIRYEDIEIKDGKLVLKYELKENQNVILIGEDVKEGMTLAKKGQVVDMGVVGIAASLGIRELKVYKKIKVGFISTGSELLEIDEKFIDGKIFNSNKYIFDAIFKKYNIESKYFGIVYDDIENLKKVFNEASSECDIVISTGGVSVGDYDLVDKALIGLGFDIFVKGINMKPGMACCFAKRNDKIVLGLSGNPMSSVTTFYAVCLPALKRMMGYNNYQNEFFKVELKNTFNKKVGKLRFLRAKVEVDNGKLVAILNLDQGNIVIKSLIDCNAMVMVENGAEVKEGESFDCMYI